MVIKQHITGAALVVATLAMSACQPSDEPLGIARQVGRGCTDANLDDRFFRGVFSRTDEPKSADVRGLSAFLGSLGEPSLSCDVGANEAYRLVYMPERGDAFSIRVERLKGTYKVTISSRATGDAALRPRNQAISQQEWEKVTLAIRSYNFWSRSPYPSPSMIDSGVIVLHGPAWLLEGQRDGWYHAVSRVSASNEAEFDLPARALFEIAGLKVPGVVRPRP